MSDSKYLDATLNQLSELFKAGDFGALSNFVKDKIIESYRNGIARGKRDAAKKPDSPIQK